MCMCVIIFDDFHDTAGHSMVLQNSIAAEAIVKSMFFEIETYVWFIRSPEINNPYFLALQLLQ